MNRGSVFSILSSGEDGRGDGNLATAHSRILEDERGTRPVTLHERFPPVAHFTPNWGRLSQDARKATQQPPAIRLIAAIHVAVFCDTDSPRQRNGWNLTAESRRSQILLVMENFALLIGLWRLFYEVQGILIHLSPKSAHRILQDSSKGTLPSRAYGPRLESSAQTQNLLPRRS